jgi:hypothetical protein
MKVSRVVSQQRPLRSTAHPRGFTGHVAHPSRSIRQPAFARSYGESRGFGGPGEERTTRSGALVKESGEPRKDEGKIKDVKAALTSQGSHYFVCSAVAQDRLPTFPS